MKLTGLMMVRNEDWCLELTMQAALAWCDELIVLDHASTDDTPLIIDRVMLHYGGQRVKVMRCDNPHWDEMDERQRMLDAARVMGATHMAIIDGDELITANWLPGVRGMFQATPPGVAVALPMVATYHDKWIRRVDGNWGERSALTLGFTDAPHLKWRAAEDGYQYHNRRPQGCAYEGLIRSGMGIGGVFHLQYISEARLKAKSAWYKCMETLRYPGRMSARQLNDKYDWTLDDCELKTTPIPPEWWDGYGHLAHYLYPDVEPWHAAEVRRLVAEHGAQTFHGLHLFGLT